METIGQEKLFTYRAGENEPVTATCARIRNDDAPVVRNYLDLARKVAHLQYRNHNHVLMFRGQHADHRNQKRNTSLKPSLFRGKPNPSDAELTRRFDRLKTAEKLMVDMLDQQKEADKRLRRQRILRWAILQHYEVCDTPLLDVTHSLRIAASFATHDAVDQAYVFVLGVPNLAGAVTASAEAGLQIVRLSSVCPPNALRPHVQEGYLLGEYPDMPDYDQKQHYEAHEIDFGRRLVAKFRFDPRDFWRDDAFPLITPSAIYPDAGDDPLCDLMAEVKARLPH